MRKHLLHAPTFIMIQSYVLFLTENIPSVEMLISEQTLVAFHFQLLHAFCSSFLWFPLCDVTQYCKRFECWTLPLISIPPPLPHSQSLASGVFFSIKLLSRDPPLLSGLYIHTNTETYCSTNTSNSARISECRPPGNIQQVLKWILSSYFTMCPTTVTVRWCFCEDNEEKWQNVQMME